MSPSERRVRVRQIITIMNFVVVSSVDIMRVDCTHSVVNILFAFVILLSFGLAINAIEVQIG